MVVWLPVRRQREDAKQYVAAAFTQRDVETLVSQGGAKIGKDRCVPTASKVHDGRQIAIDA